MLLPHCYRIEEDYFFAMCDQLGWDCTKYKTLWFITTAPPGQTRYRLCDGHIGTYNPLVQHFWTRLKTKQPSRHIQPLCGCCEAT